MKGPVCKRNSKNSVPGNDNNRGPPRVSRYVPDASASLHVSTGGHLRSLNKIVSAMLNVLSRNGKFRKPARVVSASEPYRRRPSKNVLVYKERKKTDLANGVCVCVLHRPVYGPSVRRGITMTSC